MVNSHKALKNLKFSFSLPMHGQLTRSSSKVEALCFSGQVCNIVNAMLFLKKTVSSKHNVILTPKIPRENTKIRQNTI